MVKFRVKSNKTTIWLHIVLFILYALIVSAFCYLTYAKLSKIGFVMLLLSWALYLTILIVYLNNFVVKLTFSTNRLHITYALGRLKTIPYSQIGRYTFKEVDVIKLHSLPYGPTSSDVTRIIRIKHFNSEAKDLIFKTLQKIVNDNLQELPEEKRCLLQDKNQQSFKKEADHAPNFYLLFIASLVLPVVGLILIVVDSIQNGNILFLFTSIDFGLLTSSLLPLAVILFDKMNSKKLLKLENGVLQLSNEFTVLERVNLYEVNYFYMDYRSIKWSVPSTPNSIHAINLLCFRRSSRREIRAKITALLVK